MATAQATQQNITHHTLAQDAGDKPAKISRKQTIYASGAQWLKKRRLYLQHWNVAKFE